MKKMSASVDRQLTQIIQDFKNVELVVAAGQETKLISMEDGRLYLCAAKYFNVTQTSAPLPEEYTSAREQLIAALAADFDKWWGKNLNKPLQNHLKTLTATIHTPLIPAIIIALASNQDKTGGVAIRRLLLEQKAVLDKTIVLNTGEGDHLLHIAAKGNMVDLMSFLLESKNFTDKQLGSPNYQGKNPEYLATINGHQEILDYIKSKRTPIQPSGITSINLYNNKKPQSLMETVSTKDLNI